jgi:hypothetical protein
VRQAKRHGIALRQSHTRLAKTAMVRAARQGFLSRGWGIPV